MAITVYVLCALTALTCAVLLFRGWVRSRTPLLFWAAVCFIALTVNNSMLYVDLVMVPQLDLSTVRSGIALGGITLMLIGLVWDGR